MPILTFSHEEIELLKAQIKENGGIYRLFTDNKHYSVGITLTSDIKLPENIPFTLILKGK